MVKQTKDEVLAHVKAMTNETEGRFLAQRWNQLVNLGVEEDVISKAFVHTGYTGPAQKGAKKGSKKARRPVAAAPAVQRAEVVLEEKVENLEAVVAKKSPPPVVAVAAANVAAAANVVANAAAPAPRKKLAKKPDPATKVSNKKSAKRPARKASRSDDDEDDNSGTEPDEEPEEEVQVEVNPKKSQFKQFPSEVVERGFGKATRHVIKTSGLNRYGKSWARYYMLEKDGSRGTLLGRQKHTKYTPLSASVNPRSGFDLSVADWMDIVNKRCDNPKSIYNRQVPIPRHKKPTTEAELYLHGYVERKFHKKAIKRRVEGKDNNGKPNTVLVNVSDLPITDLYSRPPLAKDAQSRYQYMINWFAIPDKAKDTTDFDAQKRAVANLEKRIMTYIMTDNRVGKKDFNFDPVMAKTMVQAAANTIFNTDCRRDSVSLKRRGNVAIPENLIVGFQIWKRLKGIRGPASDEQKEVRERIGIPKKTLDDGSINPRYTTWNKRMDKQREGVRKEFGYTDKTKHRALVNSLAKYVLDNFKGLTKDQVMVRHDKLVNKAKQRAKDSKERKHLISENKKDDRDFKTNQREVRDTAREQYNLNAARENSEYLADPFLNTSKPIKQIREEALATRAERHAERVRDERRELRETIKESQTEIDDLDAKLNQKGLHKKTRRRLSIKRTRAQNEINTAEDAKVSLRRRLNGGREEFDEKLALKKRGKRIAKAQKIPKPDNTKGKSNSRKQQAPAAAKDTQPKTQPKSKRVKASKRGDQLGEYSLNFY